MRTDSKIKSSEFLESLPKVISNRFEVKELIGRGGVGVVLKCKDNVLKNTVAVKLLLNDVSKEMAARFQREAIMAARLNHRNIVRVSDFGQNEDGRLFLVMEYLEGGTLLDEIKKDGPFPISLLIPILSKICDGLSHAHKLGVLHRDIKPANVMLSKEPNEKIVPKLVDFGLARLEKPDQQVTTGGRLMGSPSYISPEAAQGKESDARSDIYSMGCLIFECLTGVPPFLEESAFETLNSKINKPPPTLGSKSDKRFPDQVEAIVARCLTVDPELRFSSINELKQSLEDLYELEEVDEVLDESDEFSLGETLILGPETLPVKRKLNYRNIAIMVVFLIAFFVGIFFFVRNIPGILGVSDLESNSSSQEINDTDNLKTVKYNDYEWSQADTNSLEAAVIALRKKKDIRSFQVCDQIVTAYGLKLLPAGRLRRLSLKACTVDASTLLILGKMRNLEYLDLSKVEGITDEGLGHLSNLKSLKRLGLNRTQVTDKIFSILPEFKNLQILELAECNNLKGKNIENLKELTVLRELSIGGHDLAIPKETRWKFLLENSKLRSLTIFHLLFSDEDLAYIKKIPLRSITLSTTMVTDEGLLSLTDVKTLRKLKLDRCYNVTASGIRNLKAQMPNCKIYQVKSIDAI